MNNVENIVYTVSDLGAAKTLHTALLGVEPHTDQPYYVGFNVGGFEIGLTPQAPGGSVGPVAHIHVADLASALADAQRAGASIASEPRQVGPGTRIATVTDLDGTTIGLIEHAPDEV